MRKLSLFLYFGIFFIVVSCNKSTQTEDLQDFQESTEQEMIFTEGDNHVVPITPGVATMDVQLRNGNIITLDIPKEFQMNEDGTSKVEQPASSRSYRCNNLVTVYPYSNDSFTMWNIQSMPIRIGNTTRFGKLNTQFNYPGKFLSQGDIFSVGVIPQSPTYGCNDITIVVISWNCSGAKFDFMYMDFVGSLSSITLGTLNICHDKCGLKPIWSTFSNAGC